MASIVIDVDLDEHGNVAARHVLDTADAASIALLTNLKASAVLQGQHAYSVVSKHPNYPGKTRWQVLLAEVVRLNDLSGRTALGV